MFGRDHQGWSSSRSCCAGILVTERGLPVLGVEVTLARSREMALTDEDVFVRRTRLTTRDTSLGLIPSGGSPLE